jgi:hypothetical protein
MKIEKKSQPCQTISFVTPEDELEDRQETVERPSCYYRMRRIYAEAGSYKRPRKPVWLSIK